MEKRREGGFTLAELLVVVAIIGVLVAVSIPIFTGQLNNARIATDQANVRAAKVAAIAEYLNSGATGEVKYYYDAASGTVKDSKENIKGYGKSTSTDTGAEGSPVADGKASLVQVIVGAGADTPYTAHWVHIDGSSTGGSTSGDNDGGSGDNSGSGNTVEQIINNASIDTWPMWVNGGSSNFSITAGKIYSYNGEHYVSKVTQTNLTSNEHNKLLPDSQSCSQWTVKIDAGTVYTSADYSQHADQLKAGDIYKADDGTLYVVTVDTSWKQPSPLENMNNWVKILQ